MDFMNASERINEVVMVDSINASQPDFLATHVPFKKIKVKDGLNENLKSYYLSENEILKNFFLNEAIYDKHQFIIVKGSSGTGKSHFIRWLNAKLTNNDQNNDIVLLIKRDDNTLKGTIKQLLELDEVKNIANKNIYDKLIKANTIISDNKFKSQIYHQFIVEIENDVNNDLLTNLQKKQLRALLSNDNYQSKLFENNGPIERIYNKLIKQSNLNNNINATFLSSDLEVSYDFCDSLREADGKAVKMANRLIENEEYNMSKTVAKYLNGFIDDVVQHCTGIEPGDIQEIFKNIRKELKKQGKNLILLIEDITSFTGVNKELLNALVTGHTGEYSNDNTCRLISVVGATTQYFETFRDNYKERITTQITIEDGAIGDDSNNLIQFFAKYINAIFQKKETIIQWYKNGALNEEIPVIENVKNWDYYEMDGLQFPLYPFTKASIKNFNISNNALTPRLILKEIIVQALLEIIKNKKDLFLTFAKGRQYSLSDNIENKVKSTIYNMDIDEEKKEEYKSRTIALISLYNGSKLPNDDSTEIFGVSARIWNEFGLKEVSEKLNNNNNVEIKSSIIQEKFVVKNIINKEYEEFKNKLDNWFYKKSIFNLADKIREKINDFLYNTIDWQKYNVPLMLRDSIQKSAYDLIGFERQDKHKDKVLIMLDANEETRQLLSVFGKFIYLGSNSWNYENHDFDIYFITQWLDKHTNKIIDKINEEKNSTPYFIQCSFYDLIISRVLLGDTIVSKDINYKTFLESPFNNSKKLNHCTLWDELASYAEKEIGDVYKNFKDYYFITQGQRITNVHILDYLKLLKDFSNVKSQSYELDVMNYKYNYPDKQHALDVYNRLNNKISMLVIKEKEYLKSKIDYLYDFFEFDSDMSIDESDIREAINNFAKLYNNSQKCGIVIKTDFNKIDNLIKDVNNIYKEINNIRSLFDIQNDFEIMLKFSQISVDSIINFINYIDENTLNLFDFSQKIQIEMTRLNITEGIMDDDDTFAEYEKRFHKLLEDNDLNDKK